MKAGREVNEGGGSVLPRRLVDETGTTVEVVTDLQVGNAHKHRLVLIGFNDIGTIVGMSVETAAQLASEIVKEIAVIKGRR